MAPDANTLSCNGCHATLVTSLWWPLLVWGAATHAEERREDGSESFEVACCEKVALTPCFISDMVLNIELKQKRSLLGAGQVTGSGPDETHMHVRTRQKV